MKRGNSFHVSFFEIPASKSALTFEPFNIFGRTKAPRDQYHQAHLSGKFQPIWRTFDFQGSQKMKRGKHVSFFAFSRPVNQL